MTEKSLRQLILDLTEEVHELKTELEVIKSLIGSENPNMVYPMTTNPDPTKWRWLPNTVICDAKTITNVKDFHNASTNEVHVKPEDMKNVTWTAQS